MMAVTAFADSTSRDRSVISVGRVGPRLVRNVLLASAAITTAGAIFVTVALAVGWLLSTVSTTKHSDHARGNFGLRRIALAPVSVDTAKRPGPADIIVFQPSVADAARPAHVAEHKAARANSMPIPPSMPPELAHSRMAKRQIAETPQLPPQAPISRAASQRADSTAASAPAPSKRTAVYDISARAVYLPNGKTLEAHSGLGDWRDDPRYVQLKRRGPTPPNTYELSLREQLFHGVRAIRLTPVEDDKMFGRDGMLAHTYMLGPSGDSNGCVSFKNYSAFLQAYLKGDIDRLIVVPRHGAALARAGGNRGTRYAVNER
jgi:Tlde1 domain